MSKAKVLLVIVLSVVALVPSVMASIVWHGNFVFAVILLGVVIFLAIKARHVAKAMIVPLAALYAVPPYPHWLYIDNDGFYHLIFNKKGIMGSIEVVIGLSVFYSLLFICMYLLLKGTKKVSE